MEDVQEIERLLETTHYEFAKILKEVHGPVIREADEWRPLARYLYCVMAVAVKQSRNLKP